MRGVYAYICHYCDHRSALHGMVAGTEPSLYRCRLCDCEIAVDAPTRNLSKREYESYLLVHPEDPQSPAAIVGAQLKKSAEVNGESVTRTQQPTIDGETPIRPVCPCGVGHYLDQHVGETP